MEAALAHRRVVDLMNVPWPVCLFEFNRELGRLQGRDELECWVRDRDVMDNMVSMIKGARASLIDSERIEDRFRLCVKKE
jgi:hypothetical protein